jgi:hypothetical protein
VSHRTWIALGSIIAITVLAWGGALAGTFQFDDIGNVVHDPATLDTAALVDRLGHGLRPLTRLTYFADAHLFGMRAWAFLATNLLLHVASTCLVFTLARRRLGLAIATVAALVFALQPAHGEVIAYVSGRSTGLMAMFVLAGLVLHDRGLRVPALAAFALACLAKEVALVFPTLVFVWDATGQMSKRDAARRAGVYLVAAAVLAGALLLLSTYRARLHYSLELRGMSHSLVVNGRAIPTMLSLWLRPHALSADHAFTPAGNELLGITGLVAIAIALVASLGVSRRVPAFALAIAWPLLALLPTSSVIAKIDLVTEKPLYLAWIGPALAIGIALVRIRSRAFGAALAAILVVSLAVGSSWRARVWSDPVRLWEEAAAHAPGKARCWNNLGMAYRDAGRGDDARRAFAHAAFLDPSNERATLNAELSRILE